jgi:U3 small nucleolar RNA-associated protein 14
LIRESSIGAYDTNPKNLGKAPCFRLHFIEAQMARPTHDARTSKVSAATSSKYGKRAQGQKGKERVRRADLENVYEYNSGKKHRRAAVDLKLGKEDEADYQSDSKPDDEDSAIEKMKARLVKLVQEDNVELGSDDDDEIDSDAAFEESDEERFAGFTFQSNKVHLSISGPRTARSI